jgi:hypothetical protein
MEPLRRSFLVATDSYVEAPTWPPLPPELQAGPFKIAALVKQEGAEYTVEVYRRGGGALLHWIGIRADMNDAKQLAADWVRGELPINAGG